MYAEDEKMKEKEGKKIKKEAEQMFREIEMNARVIRDSGISDENLLRKYRERDASYRIAVIEGLSREADDYILRQAYRKILDERGIEPYAAR